MPVGAIAVEIVLLFKVMILALGAIILPAFPCPAVVAFIWELFRFKFGVLRVMCREFPTAPCSTELLIWLLVKLRFPVALRSMTPVSPSPEVLAVISD